MLEERGFLNGVRLGEDDVVSVREEREGVLHEIEGPTFVEFIDAE
jgi:hypothetical protein